MAIVSIGVCSHLTTRRHKLLPTHTASRFCNLTDETSPTSCGSTCKFARSVGENSHVMWDTRSPVDARQSEPPCFGNPYPPRVSHIMSEHPPMTHANLQCDANL